MRARSGALARLLAWVLVALAAPVLAQGEAPIADRYERARNQLWWVTEPLLDDVVADAEWVNGRLRYAIRQGGASQRYEMDPASGGATKIAPAAATPADMLVSPDGKWGMRTRGGNLLLIDMATGVSRPLTTDGTPDHGYAATPDSDLYALTRVLRGGDLPPVGVWSPDSRRFFTYRMDQRDVRQLPYLQSVVPGEAHQIPRALSMRVALPGDPIATTARFLVFELGKATPVAIDGPAVFLSDQGPPPVTSMMWSPDSRSIYYLREVRGYRRIEYYRGDAATGRTRLLAHDEDSDTLRNLANESRTGGRVAWPTGRGDEVILYSERDGYGHLYRVDGATGEVAAQITRGAWDVRNLDHVDRDGGWLYFTAIGREPGRDPYQRLLYRARFDGSGLILLTPETGDHEFVFAPDGRHFLDTWSTVESAPRSVLRRADGQAIATLAKGDLTRLRAHGWVPPERFQVLSADGKTPLWGTLFRPAHRVPGRKYPLLDAIYAGAFRARAPIAFQLDDNLHPQATAELGFAVMMFDARGTAQRGKAFQDFMSGNRFGRPEVMADHVAAARQIADRFGDIDIDRAGIYGHSYGGYRTVRAMEQFPDFYKAGAASSGSYDNFLYAHSGGELWHDMPTAKDLTDDQSVLPFVGDIKGRLLLFHADTDDQVHFSQTVQLIDALEKANKDYEFVLLPNRNHDLSDDPYYIRRRWDFFVRTLAREEPPAGFRIEAPR